MPDEKKKIVYLLGAGATQAEVSNKNPTVGILMSHVVSGMSKRLAKINKAELKEVTNELSIKDIDVEHLITLYEASGTKRHNRIAKQLKKLFRNEIEETLRKLGRSFFPELFTSLIDMHNISQLNEELKAVLTLNYEDLLEKAMQRVQGGINYCIKLNNSNKFHVRNEKATPILKLHGSFNWKNEYPISIEKGIGNDEDVAWIPPGVTKNRGNYPFSMLWSIARELLDCDILRIIGCSLNRNDWELISLLYTTQKARGDKKNYIIELIDYPKESQKTKDRYPYLDIVSILDIAEVRSFLISEHYPKYIDAKIIPSDVFDGLRASIRPESHNIFLIWLRAKGEALLSKNISLKTRGKNYFENFIKSGLGQ